MAVELTQQEEFAILKLNRPEALNALNFETIAEISRAIDSVRERDVRALLITGEGEKAFCAGADIKELMGQSVHEHRRTAEFGQSVFAKLDRLDVPSLAVINGYALGGGLELALACHFRIATAHAKLGFPEIKLGLIPGYGGTQRLPRLVGEARALEMIMSGRSIAAEEAERINLVHRVVDDDPLEAGMAFAREITGYSLPALGLARSAVTRALDVPLAEGFRIEADLWTLAYQTEDATEGMTAFAEKRKAVFRDR